MGDGAAAGDDGDLVTHLLHLAELVAGQEDRASLVGQLANELADLTDPGGVEAVGRLVEHEQLGVLQQGDADPEPLPHPQRVAPHEIVGPFGQPYSFECGVDGWRPMPAVVASTVSVSRPERPGLTPGSSTNAPILPITSGRPCGDSTPSSRQCPAVGRARPSRHRIVVVLPDPFGPKNPNTPPARTDRSSPSSARTRPPRRRR